MKRILLYICLVVLYVAAVVFFWPRSLADTPYQPKSARIGIVDGDDHDQMWHEIPVKAPELDEVMDLLNQYSYHCSLRTIPSLLDNGPCIEGNEAGFWVMIDLYSEANFAGECFSITSGGTKEIIFGDGVWRIGYWGNTKNLQFADAVYKLVSSYQGGGERTEQAKSFSLDIQCAGFDHYNFGCHRRGASYVCAGSSLYRRTVC